MPNEFADQLRERTMRFALRVMRFCRALPADWEGRFIADQLFRASARTSANYHAACRARSRRDFINKLGMTVEESDESVFWLTFVGRAGVNETADQKDLLAEGRELLAIFVKSAKTASGNSELISNLHSAICIADSHLPEPFHDFFEGLGAGTGARQRQRRERLVHDVQLRDEVVAVRFDVDQSGRELAAAGGLVQPLHRVQLVGRIVVLFQL